MTRQVTDQLYIDLEYFTPEDYYTYIAEAAALPAGQFSVVCEATLLGAIVEADAALTSAFSQSSDVNRSASLISTQSSQFAQTTNVNYTASGASAQSSAFTQTATALRLIDFAISVSGAFTPVMNVSAIKNSFAVLDNTTTLSVDAVANRSVDIALSSIVNQSLSGIRLAGLIATASSQFTQTSTVNRNASLEANISSAFTSSISISAVQDSSATLSSAFSVSATGSRPTRNTIYDVTTTPRYTGVTIDFNTKKWGSGSLRAEAVSNTIQPTTNIVWDGSNFKTFSLGYTWTSSDGLTWSRATNNISESISQVKYVNGYYIVDSSTNNASTNSTTFSTTAPGGMVTEFLGGFYYYGEGNGSNIFVRRSTTINGTYSLVSSFGSATGWWSQKFFSSTNTGSQIVFAFPRQTDGAGVVIYGSGTSWNINATVNASNNYAFPTIRFGGGTYVATFTTGIIRKSTNLTSWSTVSAPNTSRIRNIEYKNSNWICNDFDAVYSGSTIDNLALRYTFNSLDVLLGFDYASSKYIALHKQSALYSSNLTSWALDEIENISNAPGYIDYSRDDNTDYSQFGTMDFWINNPGGYARVLAKVSSIAGYFGVLNSNTFEFYTIDGVSLFGSVNAGWNHIRVSSSSGTISLYINGTRAATGSGTLPSTTGPLRFFGDVIANTVYIDEFLITDQVLTAPSATSFSVPTGEFTNTATTDLLLHFNGNFDDDSEIPKVYSMASSMAAAVTVSATVTKQAQASADISSTAEQTSTANRLRDVIAALTSESTLTAIAIEVAEEASANLTAEFAVNASVAITRSLESSISSQSTLTSTALRIQQGVIATDAVFSNLVAAAKVGDFLVDMASVATQTVEANRTRDVASAISSNAAVTAQTDVSKEFGAELNSETSTTATALRIQDSGALAFEAFGAEMAVVYVIARFFVNCEVVATLTADAKVTTGITIVMESNASVSAQTDVTKEFVSAQSSTTQLTAQGIKAVEAEASLSSAFTVVAQPTATLSFITTEPVVATQTAQGNITARGAADISSALQFGLTVIDVTRTVEAQLTSNSSVNIVNQRVRYMDAQIASEFSLANSLSQIKRSSVDLNATCTLLATISHIEGADLQAFANSTVSTQANVLRDNNAVLSSQATLTVEPTKLVIASAGLTAQAQVYANAGKQVVAGANISSAFTPVMTFKIIHIDPYLTWKIQAENWNWKIQTEDREFSIREETRQFIIKG